MKGRIGEEDMKRRLELFLIILLPILGLLLLGGKIMNITKKPEQKVTASSSKKVVQKSEEEIKKEQVAYLKEHEKEIVDYVKAQSPKVESVQIDWDETQMSDGGLTTPEYNMNVFGRINHIDDSGWGIDIPINNDQSIEMREMFMLHELTIGGKPIS